MSHGYTDVIVVGAGIAGLYAIHRLRTDGWNVLGIEGAPDVGGVWFHNGYPGARVDVESRYYCYFFDAELYEQWQWSERYATQPELHAYLRHVADRLDLRRSIRFGTWVISATWMPADAVWEVTTSAGDTVRCRFLVMATGQLSRPRDPAVPGLADFRGQWVQSSDWKSVDIDGKRVAVIGTGSSGVQAVTAIAQTADHTYVLQRTANYVVPVMNTPVTPEERAATIAGLPTMAKEHLATPFGMPTPPSHGNLLDFSPAERDSILEERWKEGGMSVFTAFSDWGNDLRANDIMSDFVRRKTRERIHDPELAERLLARYPVGTRRVVYDTGYYEVFNQDNVTLVDLEADPLSRVVPEGLELASGRRIELDTIVFAIGFTAFTGSLDGANIRNEFGASPSDHWADRPLSYLGLMLSTFPNLFTITGPGSPSVLAANMNLTSVQHGDVIAELLLHMRERGYTRAEPTAAAESEWTDFVAEVARGQLRVEYDNYMVRTGRDGTRSLWPFAGGIDLYTRSLDRVVSAEFEGIALS